MAIYIEDDKIDYLAYATSNNQLVFPKKLYWANSRNSVQLVYIRPVKDLHIINPSFYINFKNYVTDISEIRLTSHIPNATEVIDNNIVNITHNNNKRFVETYMWLTKDTNNVGKYIGYIGSPWYDNNSKFYCHGDLSYCFRDLKVTFLQHIVSKLDTSAVTNMSYLFANCTFIQSLNLSNWDVSNVIRMNLLTYNCTSLQSINVSNWNTGNVVTMHAMFNGNKIQELDLSHFNTEKVTIIESMFSGSQCLSKLNVSKWNTSNVTNMKNVFGGCVSLETLDLTDWNTNQVKEIKLMFYQTTSLKTLYLAFNTNKITEFDYLFRFCYNLKTISSSTFDLSNKTSDANIFEDTLAIVGGNGTTYDSNYIDSTYARVDGENGLPGYFTSPDYIEITNPSFLIKFPNYVYDSGDNLSALRYTNVIPNASEVVDNIIIEVTAERSGARTFMWLEEDTVNTGKYIGYIGCKKYTNNCTIYVSGSMFCCFRGIKLANLQNIIDQLDTSKVTNMSYCFYECENLQVLDLSNWNTSNVTDMSNMFRSCKSVTSLDLSNFDTSNVTSMNNMFYACDGLLSLDVSNFDTSSVTSMYSMFAGVGHVAGITSLDCSNFNTSNVTNMTYMFYYMTSVKKIICNTFNLTSLETDKDYWMFTYDHVLVGGNGTTLNNNYVDSTYARIDGENGLPGYFTDPATQAKITLKNNKNDGLKYLDYITINSTYTIPTLEGYTAVVTDNNGNTYNDGDTIIITQNITLTFIWTAVNN